MSLDNLLLTLKARGNFGHEGRPGKRGGSMPKSRSGLDPRVDSSLTDFENFDSSSPDIEFQIELTAEKVIDSKDPKAIQKFRDIAKSKGLLKEVDEILND